jgi:hypothetical protein
MPVWSTIGAMSRLGFSSPNPPLPIVPGATVYLDAATPTSYSGTGSIINDLTATGNNGTIIGGVTYTGVAGGSWLLDGKSGFIRVGPLANSGISNVSFTMGIWISPHTQVGNVIAMAATEPSDSWQMPPIVMDQQRFIGNVWSNDIVQSTAYTLGNWFYLTLVWDNTNSQKRFYVNGALVQTLTSVSYSSSGVSNFLGLGKNIEQASANRGWLKGYISHFHFYGGTALSDAQVLFNYNALLGRHSGSTTPPINTTNLGLYLDANRVGSANGNTTWTDLSGAGLNMTGSAASQLTTKTIASQIGNVLDGGLISPGGLISNGGSGGSGWTTATTSLLNTDTHTVSMWVKFNSTSTWPQAWNGSWEKFFSYNGGSDRSPSAWRYPENRIIHWRYAPSNSSGDLNAAALQDNGGGYMFVLDTWYNVAWTKNGATLNVYVNGVNVGNRLVDAVKNAGTSGIILFEGYGSASMQIDGLLVYNRVLSDAQIAANYNAVAGRYLHFPNNYRLVFSIDASNPASYPGSGTVVNEISGRQLVGSTTNVTYNSTATNGAGTGVGGAWVFNGSTSFISFPYDPIHDVAGNGVTAEVWVKPANFTQNGFFIEKGQVNSQYSLFMSGNSLFWRTITSGNGLSDLTVAPLTFMNTTEWHHVVGTYFSGNKKLYINGVLVGTQTNITGTINNNGNGIWLGKHALPDSYFYNGEIGEARIYNRQMSDAQVLYNYNVTKGRYAKASLPVQAALFAFTSHTFTNAGVTGTTGPTLAQCQSAYSSTTWASNASFFSVPTQGRQQFTVPATGNYRVTIAGAAGGTAVSDNYTQAGGAGRQFIFTLAMTQGDTLLMTVGQTGGQARFSVGGAGGGGGASWFLRNGTLVAVAGGGGGSGVGNGSYPYSLAGTAANDYNNNSGSSGVASGGSWNPAGSGGSSGSGGTSNTSGTGGAGGGGWTGNGTTGQYGGNGGTSYSNGSTGGTNKINCGEALSVNNQGGWGGGGGAGTCGNYEAVGGGGGGYSGGGGGGTRVGAGGGGGSFLSGGTYVSSSTNSGMGFITLERI